MSPEWSAALLSLRVAVFCVAVSVVPGVLVAYLLARRRFPGRHLLNGLVHLPLVLPPVAVGYGLLLLFGSRSPVGRFLAEDLGIRIPFTWWAAVLASAIMGFPLLVRAARIGFEAVDVEVEDAARTLGASSWDVFRNITLPLAGPALVAGMVLSFARSFGEFGATVLFAGNVPGETRTVPLALYSLAQTPGAEGSAFRLLIVAVAISFGAVVLSEVLAVRLRRGPS
jgi:molybdate transport system permease protein